jgi:spermidine/putrescine transport system permease protein
MWTNILLRINALASIFKENNILADLFNVKGIDIIGTDLAIILGMVFTYLPFIVLPIYTSLEKIDPTLEEAALDLGLTDFKKFWLVIVPMSMKGVVSGSIMVLLPCLSGFAIPKILGEGNITLIGNIIEQSFINMSYNIGSVLALVILIIILSSILLVNKIDKEGETLL